MHGNGEARNPTAAVLADRVYSSREIHAHLRRRGIQTVEGCRDMTVHHQQSVEMSFIVRDRTDDEDVRTLAHDVIDNQANQHGMLLGWLDGWGLSKTSTEAPMTRMGHGSMYKAYTSLFDTLMRSHLGRMFMLVHFLASARHRGRPHSVGRARRTPGSGRRGGASVAGRTRRTCAPIRCSAAAPPLRSASRSSRPMTPPRMSASPPARPNCSPRRSAGPPDAGRTREDDGRPCQVIT